MRAIGVAFVIAGAACSESADSGGGPDALGTSVAVEIVIRADQNPGTDVTLDGSSGMATTGLVAAPGTLSYACGKDLDCLGWRFEFPNWAQASARSATLRATSTVTGLVDWEVFIPTFASSFALMDLATRFPASPPTLTRIGPITAAGASSSDAGTQQALPVIWFSGNQVLSSQYP